MARKLLEALILGAAVTVHLKVIDKKKFTFNASVGETLQAADLVCDLTGKPKRFTDVDTFIAAALKVNASIETINFVTDTAGVRVVKIPADVIADATRRKAYYQTQKTKAIALQTSLATYLTSIATYNNSANGDLAAHYNDKAAQKLAVDGIVEHWTTQIAAADAIITPA